jgi:hypothetical protein
LSGRHTLEYASAIRKAEIFDVTFHPPETYTRSGLLSSAAEANTFGLSGGVGFCGAGVSPAFF